MILTTTFQKISEKAIGNAGYGNYVFRLYGRYVEQSSEENKTKVEFQLRHYTPQGYITYYSSSQKFTGELTNSSSNATNKRCNAGETTLLTATKEIPHEEDGTKSISIGATFTNSYFGNTVTINQVSIELPKINRLNSIVLNNGEPFFVDIEEYEPNPIPVTFKKYVDEYTSNLKLYYETSSEDGAPRYALGERTNFNSNVLNFTAVELKKIYDAIPETYFIRIICILETYDSTSKLGETEYISAGMISKTGASPTFTQFEYEDINDKTRGLTDTPQTLIKGYSQIKMTISAENKAKGEKGASITKYTFANGGQTKDIISNVYPIIFSEFIAEDKELSITAIDGRGNSTSVIKDLTNNLIEYKDIEKVSFNAERKNGGTSTEVTLKISGKIWDGNFGAKSNSIKKATYKYKKTTDTEWIAGTTTLNVVKSGGTYSLTQDIRGDLGANGFDQEESFDIYVEISDQLSTISDQFTLGAGSPGIARYKNCVALGAPYDEEIGGRVQIPKVTGETNFVTNLKKAGKEVATLEDIKDVWRDLTLTDAGKVTLSVHTFKTNGKRVVLDVNIYPKGTINAGDTLDIITIPQEYQPRNIVVAYTFSGTKTGAMWIERNTNVVRLRNQVGGWTTSNGLNISLTWDLF